MKKICESSWKKYKTILGRAALLLYSIRCVAHLYCNNAAQHAAARLKKYILVAGAVFLCSFAKADKVFDFNSTCQQAYIQITSLKLNTGEQLLQQARRENPDNLIPEMLDSYIDFYTLFLNEDQSDYDKCMPHFSERLNLVEEGPENSPFYNYCRTVIYMQRACIEIKFGKQWSAGWDFRKAFSLIKENKTAFPSFLSNNMIYGPMQVAAATIPSSYKWLAGILGIRGSLKEGIGLMQQIINSNDSMAKLFFNEASFYYCFILYYIKNDPGAAQQYIAQHQLDVVNNHLLTYMAVNLAMNDKHNDLAKSIILKRNRSTDYLNVSLWDFELAYINLHHLETQDAITYFKNFFARFKGKFYVKDAYEKLSWAYYLQGNMAAAQSARQMVLQKGSLVTDADKQAYEAAKSGTWPNLLLLKVRLLNDGGYNNEALPMLYGKSINDFDKPEDKLEFAYRVGRIYDELGRNDDAVKMYQLAIKLGAESTEYYAARAALQTGYIYEKQGKKDLAIQYFQQCLDMKDHDYKDSLDQKAKAGIERCKGN